MDEWEGSHMSVETDIVQKKSQGPPSSPRSVWMDKQIVCLIVCMSVGQNRAQPANNRVRILLR